MREVGLVGGLDGSSAGERQSPEGSSVIGVRRRDDAPATFPALRVIAARQSQGHFVRLRTSRDEANARELGRRNLEDASSELLLRLVRELVVVDVGEALGLPHGRFDDVAPRVTEDGGHRATAAAIQELAAVDTVEANALAPLDVGIRPVQIAREDVRPVSGDLG